MDRGGQGGTGGDLPKGERDLVHEQRTLQVARKMWGATCYGRVLVGVIQPLPYTQDVLGAYL